MQPHSTLTSPPPKIHSRGQVQIIYSSTSGNSKAAAEQLQIILQTNRYVAPIFNIGDYDPEQLIGHKGNVIMLLSTYGDGRSPADGEQFLTWIEHLNVQGQEFQHLHYAILALGNSNFHHHCGFGLRTQSVLKKGGGQQLLQLTKCDASKQDKNYKARFPSWSESLVQKLNQLYPLVQTERGEVCRAYKVVLDKRLSFDWRGEIEGKNNIAQQFMSYWQMHKCKVIHVRQLRGDSKQSKRSTLWVRLDASQHPKLQQTLTPAINLAIFPINLLQNHPQDDHIVNFTQVKGKLPFPPMPLRQIRQLLNYTRIASDKQIKQAINLSQAQPDVVDKYEQMLKEKEEISVTIRELMEELKPTLQFMAHIGMNRVRTSNLASWDPKKEYIDLVVSLVPQGLISAYLSSNPKYLRLRPVVSPFYIPSDPRPICMVANGAGIAPFRSTVQYMASLPVYKRSALRFYYGIQRQGIDYYFQQQWKQYQQKKLIQMRVAQSRRDKQHKQYVQDLLNNDVEWIHEHLFRRNGLVFICGGAAMSQQVYKAIIKAIEMEVGVEEACGVFGELREKKTIVQQVYG